MTEFLGNLECETGCRQTPYTSERQRRAAVDTAIALVAAFLGSGRNPAGAGFQAEPYGKLRFKPFENWLFLIIGRLACDTSMRR